MSVASRYANTTIDQDETVFIQALLCVYCIFFVLLIVCSNFRGKQYASSGTNCLRYIRMSKIYKSFVSVPVFILNMRHQGDCRIVLAFGGAEKTRVHALERHARCGSKEDSILCPTLLFGENNPSRHECFREGCGVYPISLFAMPAVCSAVVALIDGKNSGILMRTALSGSSTEGIKGRRISSTRRITGI